jgi:Ca2+-binding EF-hand superfamily protein
VAHSTLARAMILAIPCRMELMTSLFIDSLMEEKRRQEKEQNLQFGERRCKVEELITGLFDVFDDDGNGVLDAKELDDCMQVFKDKDTSELMSFVGIDARTMGEAIKVADINCDGMVSRKEFRKALDSINAVPRQCDIREVHQRVATLQHSFQAHKTELESVKADVTEIKAMLKQLLETKK